MAGATKSGEEMQTGRTNRAEDRTIIWAQVQPDEANFEGPAILIVEVAQDAENPDDYDPPGAFQPSNSFHGVMATGWSGGGPSSFGGAKGAVGIIGRGGRNEGTGVVGLGGGTPEPGNGGEGGIGVHGFGGPKQSFFADPAIPPGAGMVAQGGRQSDTDNRLRLPHAAGLIAIGGGTGLKKDLLPAHPLTVTGGVGVYGQGAEATVTMVGALDADGNTIPGAPDVPSGPLAPGAGVLGRGGVPIPRDQNLVAAGVIGLAGDTAIPPISETGNKGVYGRGPVGIFGHGFFGVYGKSETSRGVFGETDSDVGVFGSARKDTGRGGAFQSGRSAQVWLIPQNQPTEFPTPVAVTPTVIRAEREGPKLPKDGRGGDLMAIADKQGQCTLWFCVKGEGAAVPARWAQVLLGPSFDGQA